MDPNTVRQNPSISARNNNNDHASPTTRRRNGGVATGATNYTFYDEKFKPMWNRGISRKIGESAFVQQSLPTYRLSWSPLKICPVMLLLGAFFTGLGVGIKKFSENIQEVVIPYTNCISVEDSNRTCSEVLQNSSKVLGVPQGKLAIFLVDANDIANCTCNVKFELKEPMNGTVYIYYALENFYQNHLRYYLSRDENQLKGDLFDDGVPKDPSSACEPLHKDSLNRIIYPCGLMANSMFTDVINLIFYPEPTELARTMRKSRNFSFESPDSLKQNILSSNDTQYNMTVPLIRTGIAWESDKEDKYHNPSEFENENDTVWLNFVKPYGWKKTLWQLDPTNSSNNGVLNEDFIVWMRTAAFPWFRKLYRIVDSRIVPFNAGLPAGNYSLHIQYNYDVSTFDGGKKIIITTTKMVAGKNMFLAIVYMATGAICMFLSIVLFVLYKCTGSMQFLHEGMKQD